MNTPPLAVRFIIFLIGGSFAFGDPDPARRIYKDDRNHLTVETVSDPDHYYILLRGGSPNQCTFPISMKRGDDSTGTLADGIPLLERGFFSIKSISVNTPLDTDGDGINDLIELDARPFRNPLNAARSISPGDGMILLPDKATFDSISHRDNFPGASNVREVKFLIMGVDGTNPSLYFLNLNRHVFHYYFAQSVLGYTGSLNTFNDETYFSNRVRKNLAGSLIVHESWLPPGHRGPPGIIAMEFWPSDPISYPLVQVAYDLVSRSMLGLAMPIAYHPASETQRSLMRSENNLFSSAKRYRLHTISSEELIGQTAYTLLNPGVGFGRLILYDGAPLSARDIPIFRTLPNAITRTAGIITETAQTPLSHINLKAKQNNTPNVFIRNASTNAQLVPLLGKYVRFEPGPDGFAIREATSAEVDTWLEALRPPTVQVPVSDLAVQTIKALGTIGFRNANSVGAKSANIAEMRKFLPSSMVPDGWAVPFYFYDQFMKYNNLYSAADAMMAELGFSTDTIQREARLLAFRKTIRNAPFPSWINDALNTVQAAFPTGQPIRCRSSTNNEDIEGFSGAGLYDSYTHRPDEGQLIITVKKVWASLWNIRAWDEREFYRVRHLSTMMGVLLIPNFDDEIANGVGVTRNIIDPDWTGYYINAQAGESLVTNPDPNSIPEEFLIAQLLGATQYEIQYVTFSNLVLDGTTVITREQAEALADRMSTIQSRFFTLYNGGQEFAMEIEWKITSTGQLVIKQARPWVE